MEFDWNVRVRSYACAVAVKILVLIISCAAFAAGCAYARMASRMSSFSVTRGNVIRREVAPVPVGAGRDGRWGKGGAFQPKVTYTYVVDGIAYTCDRWSYAIEGLKHAAAEQVLADVPDEVDVHYDPADPQMAYLHTHRPRMGWALMAGGAAGVIGALATLFG